MTYIEGFEEDAKRVTQELTVADKLAKAQITLDKEIKPPPPVIQVDNKELEPITIFTEGNLSVIQGLSGVRKTFAIGMFTACSISEHILYRTLISVPRRNVLYFDTEQSSFYVQQSYQRITRMAGSASRLYVFCLRPFTPNERTELIDYAFNNVKDIGFVVIDGIRDLVSNINDPDEATSISSKLLKWSEESGAHILNVLHENKSDGKLRGHIGTELSNKAETVLKVEMLDNDIAVSKISCVKTRGLRFDPIYFRVIDNIPEVISNYIENTGGFT